MPHAHNQIEALALGCVPIINYADLLTPKMNPFVEAWFADPRLFLNLASISGGFLLRGNGRERLRVCIAKTSRLQHLLVVLVGQFVRHGEESLEVVCAALVLACDSIAIQLGRIDESITGMIG